MLLAEKLAFNVPLDSGETERHASSSPLGDEKIKQKAHLIQPKGIHFKMTND